MEKQSTRVTLRKAKNALKEGQQEERLLIEKIIQEVRSTDIPIKKIVNRLTEKKEEHKKKLKMFNRVIHQIQLQDEQGKNAQRSLKTRDNKPSKKSSHLKIKKRSSSENCYED